MVICKFWLQGRCKFGDNCRDEHSRNPDTRSNNNRFAPLNDQRNYDQRNYDRSDGNHSRYPGGNSRNPPRQNDYKDRAIDQDLMRKELSTEMPIWILSSYSPRADLPKQLFGGPKRELSPEEVRLRHHELAAQGRMQEAVEEAVTVYQAAKTQTDNVLTDIARAIKYLQNGFDEHPNRIDICNESTRSGASALNNTPTIQIQNPPTTSTSFGQPSGSNFGSNTGTTFGQASGSSGPLKVPQATPFGQAVTGNATSTFGQPSLPSTLGFGQASTLGSTSGFGRPSLQRPAFAQPSAASNPFAVAPPKPAFGQTSNPGNNAPVFGQPSGPSASIFGQPSQSTKSAFGQPSNSFAQQQVAPQNSSFGGPARAFGRSLTADSGMSLDANQGGFSSASNTMIQSPTFQQLPNGTGPSTFGQPTSNGNAFGKPSTSTPFGQVPTAGRGFSAASQRLTNGTHLSKVTGTSGKLQEWNGRAVRYIDDQPCFQESDGAWQRIWFADGPPVWAKPEILPLDLPYDGDLEERYRSAKQDGQFRNGLIPLSPPKREWTSWDF